MVDIINVLLAASDLPNRTDTVDQYTRKVSRNQSCGLGLANSKAPTRAEPQTRDIVRIVRPLGSPPFT